jgi:hypothetical protein
MKLKTSHIIILILLAVLFLFGWKMYHDNQKFKDRYNTEVKLREALSDSLRYYTTAEGEWGVEKRTLQGDIDDLLNENVALSKSQRSLLQDVKRLDKERKNERQIFAAARIEYEALIDSLNTVLASATSIDTLNNSISFVQTDTAAHFIYDLDVFGVRPSTDLTPQLRFNKIDFPNKQTILFQFDKNKRKDYPVSFSVINSNEHFKVYDIESYAIQGIQKDIVNPNGWQKVWKWVKINGKYILVGAAGFAVGTAF